MACHHAMLGVNLQDMHGHIVGFYRLVLFYNTLVVFSFSFFVAPWSLSSCMCIFILLSLTVTTKQLLPICPSCYFLLEVLLGSFFLSDSAEDVVFVQTVKLTEANWSLTEFVLGGSSVFHCLTLYASTVFCILSSGLSESAILFSMRFCSQSQIFYCNHMCKSWLSFLVLRPLYLQRSSQLIVYFDGAVFVVIFTLC